jgi:hypothetical protein
MLIQQQVQLPVSRSWERLPLPFSYPDRTRWVRAMASNKAAVCVHNVNIIGTYAMPMKRHRVVVASMGRVWR